ncbi:ferredoxin-type protein NapG [Vibrio breoganii]|uniref:ferredoxin-type protein NapG n=1 Tax=Vibrio breoganii TaxID=553239 RepID=UPI000C83D319|nr:ferredoxin-type protein NapG [Vibrio breoganii]PMK26323.1 ferredoxin-type protein NapG [Vibrio breoganii]PML86051.1 ferredoxin-type protein NapG [Vibrio breoganii]
MSKPKNGPSPSRRRFLRDAARTAVGVASVATLLGIQSRQSQAGGSGVSIRPPGALPAGDFEAACVRCGLCVQACPYDTLKLSTLMSKSASGIPYFTARDIPCEMCDHIPCVVACPTGALDPALTNIDDALMGTAVLIDHETCLNYLGLRCDVCYRVCPLIDEAITLEYQRNTRTGIHAKMIPTVHSESCTGCGKCEQACVLPVAAIKVVPTELAKGELGHHYKLGWKGDETIPVPSLKEMRENK